VEQLEEVDKQSKFSLSSKGRSSNKTLRRILFNKLAGKLFRKTRET